MGFFMHNSVDDAIIISDGVVTPMSFTLAFFLTQYPAYTLPSPYTARWYEQGVEDILTNSTNSYTNTLPWSDGNTYITNVATLQTNWLDYRYPPTLAKIKSAQKGVITDYADTYYNGGVSYGGTVFQSTARPISELDQFGRQGELDPTHYILDEDNNQVSVTFQELLSICNLILGLWFETNKTLDTHKSAIDALGTISAVRAYVYTGGWPVTPFTG